MVASGVAELVSLGAVLPFLTVLSDSAKLWQQPFVRELTAQMGVTQEMELLRLTTVAFVLAAALAPDPIVEFVAEWSPCSGCWIRPEL